VKRWGSWTKLPVRVCGGAASSTDPATWSTYEAAKASGSRRLGFVLGGGIGCIDLDHCIDGGVVADWAQAVLDAAPATYVEVSPSSHGLHVWGLLPEGRGRVIRDGRSIEVYSAGRYMTVTGRRWAAASSRMADLSEVVEAL
jgi:primase-polymerase (primpol)-like protein